MTEITCPHCGKQIHVNDIGRKRINIDAKIIYGALRDCRKDDGSVNFTAASRKVVEKTGIPVCRDFVRTRVLQFARQRHQSRDKFLVGVLK